MLRKKIFFSRQKFHVSCQDCSALKQPTIFGVFVFTTFFLCQNCFCRVQNARNFFFHNACKQGTFHKKKDFSMHIFWLGHWYQKAILFLLDRLFWLPNLLRTFWMANCKKHILHLFGKKRRLLTPAEKKNPTSLKLKCKRSIISSVV